jgi:hypothetical protein
MTAPPVELRMRTRVHPDELAAKAGKLVTAGDFNVLLTGTTVVRKPDGRPLCVYLPGYLAAHAADPDIYRVLHGLRSEKTDNRGLAGGSRRIPYGATVRTRAAQVPSAVVGALDPGGAFRYCRLTAWTGRHLPDYELLSPLLGSMAAALATYVPDRYAVQADAAGRAHPDWIVPGTPFSTVTVNNTYPTGVHTDKGDLAAGFSTLAVLRRGSYTGGVFVMPEYRVAVDMHDGDLLLLDAHDWHGNTALELASPDAERISVVAYYREGITACGTAAEEAVRAAARRAPKERQMT